jgi:hypothetical protein
VDGLNKSWKELPLSDAAKISEEVSAVHHIVRQGEEMMMKKWFHYLTRKLLVMHLLLPGIVIALSAGWSYSDDLPSFRRGMWEFHRTIEGAGSQGKPQTITNKKCTDPTEDMKKQNEMLSKAGCTFSPVTRGGNVYSFTSDCTVKGVSLHGKTVITVESDGAYTVSIETRQGMQVTKETLKARRTGDCPY